MPPEKCIVDPERDCLGLIKAAQLEKDLAEVEKDMSDLRKQNSASHERIFDRLGKLETQEGIQGEQYKHILEKLTDLGDKLSSLGNRLGVVEAKPGKRWEAIVGQVIGLVVAALVGAAIARLGL